MTRILFPYDFSRHGEQAASTVRAMAERLRATVTLYSVIPPVWDHEPEGMEALDGVEPEDRKPALQARLDKALIQELAGIDVERVADSGNPAARITAFTQSHDIDFVMMPTHGQGKFRASLIGSVTAKVLHDVACPVWTAAHTDAPTSLKVPGTIVCAIDGSDRTPAVLSWTKSFSAALGARLTLLHVVLPVSDWDALASEHALQEQARDDAEAKVAAMQEAAGVIAPLRVTIGDIGATVAEQAHLEHADLVIVGRGAVEGRFPRLRSHTFDIIERAPCPVLNV